MSNDIGLSFVKFVIRTNYADIEQTQNDDE